MRILVTANHGDIFSPKEGGDVRRHFLILELSKQNDIIALESDRYYSSYNKCESKIPIKNIRFFKEFYLFGKPLPMFTDLNLSFISNLLKIIRKDEVDLIQVSFPVGIVGAKLLLKIIGKDIPIVYDSHNVESDIVKITKRIPRSIKPIFIIYTYFLEYAAVKSSNLILAVSEKDKLNFLKKYKVNPKKLVVIPTGAKVRNQRSNEVDRNKTKKIFGIDKDEIVVMFHGTYAYPPNQEAIKLIEDYLAPESLRYKKNIRFVIAGHGVPKLERSNIKFVGFVDNLDQLLCAADIAIVPDTKKRTTGTTRVKLLEYLGFGLPVVATKTGIEGVDITNGVHAIVTDDVNQEFVEAIKYLADNEQERRRIGENAQKLIEDNYSWEKIGEKLNELYRNLLQV